LPKEILKIMNPLFCEMEDLQQELNLNDFIDAACNLYETLSLPDKRLLQNFGMNSTKKTSKISPVKHQVFSNKIIHKSLF